MPSPTLAASSSQPAPDLIGKPAPPLFLGAVILFWGWQTQNLGIAVSMAVLTEAAYWLRTHTGISWYLSDKDFNRFADFTTLLWVVAAVYFFNKESIDGLFSVLRWFPGLMLLLLLSQLYSSQQHIPLSALFWSLRYAQNQQKHHTVSADNHLLYMRLDLSYPYAVICLLSASVAQQPYFLLGALVFFAWGLYKERSPRYSLGFWLLLFMLAGAGGYAGQQGIQHLQRYIERRVLEWFDEQFWDARDPYQQNTRIGDIGELKLSDQILFRVKATEPLLLREASYSSYKHQNWYAQKVDFQVLPTPINNNIWTLNDSPPPPHTNRRLDISLYLPKGRGMLPLPNHSRLLHLTPGPEIQRNRLDGAVKITDAPNLLNYRVDYAQTSSATRLQQNRGQLLNLPQGEADTVKQLVNELGLDQGSLSPREKIRRIEAFFAQNFRYSLVQREQLSYSTPLARFLLHTRHGHCEYFASSTVLLLRAAGIPSRYVVGFAAQEYSFLEDTYVVRRRHAHAWAQAYVDGHWLEIDTTPADWVEQEAEAASYWQGLGDLWAWLKHRFDQWRWHASDGNNNALLWWLLPLSLLLLWRLSLHKKYRRKNKAIQVKPKALEKLGKDSPFYAILKQLQAQGYPHAQGQSLHHWLQQLQATPHNNLQQSAALSTLLALHNRYRFHPQGLAAQEKAQFAQAVENWLAQQQQQSTKRLS